VTKDELIGQGYLEAYLTGDLTVQEQQEVEQLLHHDEVALAFLELQTVLETMTIRAGIPAPANVRKSIARTLMYSPTDRPYRMYLVAASLALLIFVSLGGYYFVQYQKTIKELDNLIAQNAQMADNIRQVNTQLDGLKQNMAVLANPAFERIILNTTDPGVVQQAVIYFNASEQQVFLNTSSLAMLDENAQYQLWALIDGLPVDAGVFDVLPGEFQQMKSFGKADAFAVTIEPRGGSVNPTLEKLQVIGKVTGG
jgi:hypothetical protein